MTYVVSTLQSLGNGPARISLLLSYNGDRETRGIKAIRDLLSAFGSKAGTQANAVLPGAGPQASCQIAEQIAAKAWPGDVIGYRLRDGAACLIAIEGDFATFQPGQHNWVIVWLDEISSKKNYIARRLGEIEAELRPGRNPLASWEAIAKRDAGKTHPTIVSKAHPQLQNANQVRQKRRPGPEGMMSEGLGVKEFIAQLHDKGEVEPETRSYVSTVAQRVQAYLSEKGHAFDLKSISERIRKSKLLVPYRKPNG